MGNEPTEEVLEAALAILESQDKARSLLEAQSYDGVLGLPPAWVPQPFIENFRNIRNRMVDVDGWTPEQLRASINTYGTDQWVWSRLTPAGRGIDPVKFLDDVGFLAHLRYCVSLGVDEGLTLLAGKHAYQGYRQREGSKQPRRDALRRLIEATYDGLRGHGAEPTWRDVLRALSAHDSANEFKRTIQEIDYEAEVIRWLNGRDKEKETSFASFRDRLTGVRKPRR